MIIAGIPCLGWVFGNVSLAHYIQSHCPSIVATPDDKNEFAHLGRYLDGNSLSVASYRGHDKIVQMLLERGADINAQSGYYGNLLCATSSEGHHKILQML
ncbi:hypothetical protein N7494_007639 [Penicillium frequentans]|uniref:Uncharacterized protein n=1 Tax=Penicillium frequentans TaxID=3151616 RepID=A0AAD6CSY3_9EURO|nr:hypothetical protein N7494_007639 [Penicillium glabrum]